MAQRAIIIANGIPAPDTDLPALLRPDDLLIAADGGARVFMAASVTPHYVVGDFDSLAPGTLTVLESQGAQAVRHPARKDETDMELAIRLAVEKGAGEVLILGALGGRWDQTLANVLLLALPAFADVRLRLLDGRQEITLLRPGREHRIVGQVGDTVSLIPIGGDARGVTASGLEWPLQEDTLRLGATRGVSNVLIAPEAVISLREGLLVCVVIGNQ